MSAPRSGWLEVPGGKLPYEIAGSGPPVVFVAAAICDLRQWHREFEKFSPRATVVRYDRRGFGRAPPATAAYSDVEDLALLIQSVGKEPAIVVGNSNGGRIAIDLALDHPDLVRGLLLVASGISGFDSDLAPEGNADYERDGARMKDIFDAWTAGRKDEAKDRMLEYWCSAQTGANRELAREMIRDNAQEIFTDASANFNTPSKPPAVQRIGSLHVRTVVLQGDRDEPTMNHIGRWIGKSIPGARYVAVPGGDHVINLSKPDVFDASLDSLLG